MIKKFLFSSILILFFSSITLAGPFWVIVKWDHPETSLQVIDYEVYRSQTPGVFTDPPIWTSSREANGDLSINWALVTGGVNWSYIVKARYPDNVISIPSNEIQVTITRADMRNFHLFIECSWNPDCRWKKFNKESLSPSSVTQIDTTPVEQFTLEVSKNSNRTDSQTLNGQTLSGNVYIFSTHISTFTINKVEFWLDDSLMNNPPLSTELNSPYDFSGGSEVLANAFDTKTLPNGSHTITAKFTLNNNTEQIITHIFMIDN